jgi:ATP-dependent DNA helicase 2 subunit 1
LGKRYFNNKDCVIFLVDAQPAMFVPTERDEIPFRNAIKCAIATMTDKIISSDTDLLGICFYGTDQKKNMNEFDNLYVLQVGSLSLIKDLTLKMRLHRS